MAGMGELHLEILVDRMKREFNVEATVGKPQVAYRETIMGSADVDNKYIKQTGGKGQYGHVKLNIKPLEKLEEGAKILANVKASDALVSGEVKGNMRVEEKLQLTASARVLGDIYCRVLEVESGPIVHGKVTMTDIEIEDIHPERKRATVRTKSKTEFAPHEMTEDVA